MQQIQNNRFPRAVRRSIIATALAAFALPAAALSNGVVISQVYGGGGNSGATYRNDFVELFNRGSTAVSLSGWSLQYASSTGSSWSRLNLSGTIQPGQYFLIQLAQGSSGTQNLPSPNLTGTLSLSTTSGKLALRSSTTSLTCSTGCATQSGVVDFVGYGSGVSSYEGSAPTATLSTTTAALRGGSGCNETDNNGADFGTGAPTPRNSASPTVSCSSVTTRIRDIQGSSHTSPRNGQSVTGVEGVVTARASTGFYMQDTSPDSNNATSEGIFVYTASSPVVNVGDRVRVGGTVSEYRPGGSSSANLTTTEIVSPTITIVSTGNSLPAPIVIGSGGRIPPTKVIDNDATGNVETSGSFDSSSDGIDFYESLEGMRVQLNNAQVVGPTDSSGELVVIGDFGANASGVNSRDGITIAADDYNPERVIIDNALQSTPSANVGDWFSTVVGVMDYANGNYHLLATQALSRVSGGIAAETTSPQATSQLAIASFNVENLDPNDGTAQFDALARQIVTNLQRPDILALAEVQDNDGATNSSTVSASTTYSNLISAIQRAGGPTYQYRQIDPQDDQDGGEPGGNIRVGFLYNSSRVSFVDRSGATATTANSVQTGPQLRYSPGRIDPQNSAFSGSRKPLAGEFSFNGKKLFVIANHFNSKGGDDPLYGRYQPPALDSETQREQQATVVANFVRSILTLDANANVVVLGDLNDFEFSSSLTILKNAGLYDLIETLPAAERYTYVYEGNSQALDHILVSSNLRFNTAVEYDVVHVNAEFASQLSDHDPEVARFNLP